MMIKGLDLVKAAPRYIGQEYSRMDCQAFVEKCLSDIGIKKDLPGSNAWYREVMAHGWVGTPEECKKKNGGIPAGAFLFILEQDGREPEKYKADGIGNASHIGIYTGMTGREMCDASGVTYAEKWNFGDGAIHSSSSHGHVCTSNFRGKSISGGWNRVGLWDQLFKGGESMGKATVVGGGLNMRTSPDKKSDILIQIPNGSTVEVLENNGDWAYVSYSVFTGYVMTQYLEFSADGESVSVPRKELESIYDTLGDWLGLRG